jgi:hypothetical protein
MKERSMIDTVDPTSVTLDSIGGERKLREREGCEGGKLT